MMNRARFVFLVAVCLWCPTSASASQRSHVVVINLADPSIKWRIITLSAEKSINPPKSATGGTSTTGAKAPVAAPSATVDPCPDPQPVTTVPLLICVLNKAVDNSALVGSALKDADAFQSESETRFLSGKGDTVEIYVFYNNTSDAPTIQYTETKRASRFASDISTLAQLILSGKLPVARVEPTELLFHETHVLAEDRGTLTVGVTPPSPKGAPKPTGLDAIASSIALVAGAMNAQASTKTPAQKQDTAISGSVLTGSQEHWFISANVNVTRFSQLTLDSTSNSIVLKDKSPKFLLAANYFLGDLAASKPRNVFIGLAFEPSTDPTSAIGPVLGLRFSTLKWLGLSFDSFSPFVGYLRITNEQAANPSDRVSGRVVAGLSFNLDSVVQWLK